MNDPKTNQVQAYSKTAMAWAVAEELLKVTKTTLSVLARP